MRTRIAILVLLAVGTTAIGQPPAHPFRLDGLLPAGPRTNVTENWGTLRFSLTNTTDTPRDARVVVFYPEQADVQYGRDVWLPPRATVGSWLTVGPAPSETKLKWSRDLKFQLYEKADGGWSNCRLAGTNGCGGGKSLSGNGSLPLA